MCRRKLFLNRALGSVVALSAVALGGHFAAAQQPERFTQDFGVSARQPGLGTASLGTDGARFSSTIGRVNASMGTNGMNAGLERCAEWYPIPSQVGRLGARVCGQVTPNGLQGTITPGTQLPTGTQIGAYYRFNYNPLAEDPAASPPTQPQQNSESYTPSDDRLLQLLRDRAAERAHQQEIDNRLAAQIAANAYNPPAEFTAQVPAAAPAPQNELESVAPPQANHSGLSEAEFRAEMARIHREFQQADEYHRQHPLNIPVPQENQTPPIGDVPPAGVRPRVVYNDYAPRNGYDPQGNRADSSRRRYDENGNYVAPPQRHYSTAIDSSSPADFWQWPAPQAQVAPQRQNRVYSGNTSRPIGSGRSNIAQQAAAMQQWSNNQIAAMNARRSAATQSSSSNSSVATPAAGDSLSSATDSSSANTASPRSTGFGYDESARRGSQIVYDDNVPRGGSTSVLDEEPQRPISSPVYDHRPGQSGIVDPGDSSTDPPAITPRAAGESAPTAALRW